MILTFIGTAVFAEDIPTYELNKITVQAEEQQADAVIEVSSANIGAAKTIPDLLRNTAGIQVQARANAGGNEDLTVKLRGHDSRHYTVLVDGVPQSMSGVMGGGYVNWNAIPLNMVDKIEIIKGAKSAAYGQTDGGVINIITKKNFINGGDVELTTGSNGRRQYTLNYGIQKDTFGFAMYANKSTEDAYLRNSDYNNQQIGLNFHYNINKTNQLKFNIDHEELNRGLVIANIPGTPGYNNSYPITLTGDTFASSNGTPGDGSYSKIYRNNYNISWDSQRSAGTDTITYWRNDEKQREYSLLSTGILAFDRYNVTDQSSGLLYTGSHIINKKHTLGYGIDYKMLRYGYGWYNSNNTNSSALYPSQKTDTLGMYVEDTWILGKRWQGNAGLRYDQMKGNRDDSRATQIGSMNDQSFSPKLNFSFKNNKSTTTTFSVNRIWRAPSMAEFYWHYMNTWGFAAGNNLKPEKGWGYEASVDHQFNKKIHTKAILYYQNINNYINFAHTYPFNCYNINHATLWGLELENTYHLTPYSSIFLNYTNQHTEKDGVNPNDKIGLSNELDYRPHHTISLGYQFDRYNWHVRYDMTFTSNQSATLFFPSTKPLNAKVINIGSYLIHNVSITKDLNKNESINISLYNIFDKNYCEIYGYPMEGRFYTATFTQKF